MFAAAGWVKYKSDVTIHRPDAFVQEWWNFETTILLKSRASGRLSEQLQSD
jgi:hypothetical protein